MATIRENHLLMNEMDRISEVAGYLWERGWAERNGGNISVNVTHLLTEEQKQLPAIAPAVPLGIEITSLVGNVFYVTGTGRRMRDVAKNPFDNGAFIRITAEGLAYEIIAEKNIKPTSELPSHLMMHNYQKEKGRTSRIVLHTHVTDLIGLSHCAPFLDSDRLTKMLWSMIPECRVIVPKGIGVVPYALPGSVELAKATIEQLDKHDVVLWEKHGVLSVGEDLIECFDSLDTLSKSAQIYLTAKTAGFEPQGMTDEQLEDLKQIM